MKAYVREKDKDARRTIIRKTINEIRMAHQISQTTTNLPDNLGKVMGSLFGKIRLLTRGFE